MGPIIKKIKKKKGAFYSAPLKPFKKKNGYFVSRNHIYRMGVIFNSW